ncbi:MAG: MaoC family dehydratase [Actinomycetota bacterium]
MADALVSWSAHAPNLPEHADNPIHTDEGARAAGYPAAVVAGTTVYALMTHPAAAAWGDAWIGRGGCEVRFRGPVLADDGVECRVAPGADGRWTVEAVARDEVTSTLEVWLDADVPEARAGEQLPSIELMLDATWAEYGTRSGDDLATYTERGIAHPAVWPSLGNRVFKEHLVTGPWIHTRSRIAHAAVVARDTPIRIDSVVVDRFDTRAGRRAVVDCHISDRDGRVLCVIEHEAIIELF